MSRNITEYDILISCPGDIDHIVPLIRETFDIFNSQYSEVLGLRLNAKHWSDSSYNQSGGMAQELLNKQFVHDCDAAIAVFWTRFGSPTDKYGSGTEEEIENMLASGKQVFLYFCEERIAPEKLLDEKESDQYKKVKAFQKGYADEGKGIYSCFTSDADFKKQLLAHLALHFIPLKKEQDQGIVRKSKLELKGIVDGKPADHFVVGQFVPYGVESAKQRLNKIRNLLCDISHIHIVETQSIFQKGEFFGRQVSIDSDQKKIIEAFAQYLKYDIPKDFFSLGQLREDTLTVSLSFIGGRKLIGSDDEKRKYNYILQLSEEIGNYLNWIKFEDQYCCLNCIKLALSNGGTAFDEDVDISLVFKQDGIIVLPELPEIDENTCRYLVKEYKISDLFGIRSTSAINDFNSSAKSSIHVPHFSPVSTGVLGDTTDYEEEYQDDLASAFEYDFFQEGNQVIVKLHIDYIKHNTVVAFPTVLFVREPLAEIPYSIRSKHNADIVQGIIHISETNEK